MSSLELGQMVTSGKDWQRYDADWATDGLVMIAQVIAELRGEDPNDGWTTLTSNSGGEDFVNDVFEMRSYCWCEGDSEDHPDGCPPNFIYKPENLIMTWYKHAGRSISCNKKYLGANWWFNIIQDCVRSMR